MAIDINLLDVWGNVQDRIWQTLLPGYTGPALPTTPMRQYLFLEHVRRQAARTTAGQPPAPNPYGVPTWAAAAEEPPPPPRPTPQIAGFKLKVPVTLGMTGELVEPPAVPPAVLLGGAYIPSSVYEFNNPPTMAYMNSGSADGSTNDAQTGTDGLGPWTGNIYRDLGAMYQIHSLVIGYDYLINLPAEETHTPGMGWGPEYTKGCNIFGGTEGPDIWPEAWNWIGITPDYAETGSSNGLVTIPIAPGPWRWIAIQSSGDHDGYMCLTEFQVIGWAP